MKNRQHNPGLKYSCLIIFSLLTFNAGAQSKKGTITGTYAFWAKARYVEKEILILSKNNKYCWERVFPECCGRLIYAKTYGKYKLVNDTLLLKTRKIHEKIYTGIERKETKESVYRRRFTKKVGYQNDTITVIYDEFKIAKYGKIADKK